MAQKGTENTRINATETTFAIVEAVNDRNGAGVMELADHLDLAQSTVHDHLSTLVALDYLVKDDGEYRLGLKFLDHGINARDYLGWADIARAEIRALAEEIEEVVWLYTEEYGRAVAIDKANRDHSAGFDVAQIGWRPPLHSTSAGKAMLAHMSPDRIDRILERHGLPELTDDTITSREGLFEEFETIREQGYATNREEHVEGIHAIGAPVRFDDRVVAAVSISGASYQLSKPDVRESLLDALLETTNQIELNLKYR